MESFGSLELDVRKWVVSTFYGWLIGFVLVIVLSVLFDVTGINSQFFVGTGMAVGVGFMQNRILKKTFGWNRNWMWTNILGITIPFIFIDLGSSVWNLFDFSLPISIISGAVLVGLLQFKILKSKGLKMANYWIVFCVFGWSLAGVMVGLSDYLNQVLPKHPVAIIPFLLLVVVFSSLLLGWITGKGLAIIFKNNTSNYEPG